MFYNLQSVSLLLLLLLDLCRKTKYTAFSNSWSLNAKLDILENNFLAALHTAIHSWLFQNETPYQQTLLFFITYFIQYDRIIQQNWFEVFIELQISAFFVDIFIRVSTCKSVKVLKNVNSIKVWRNVLYFIFPTRVPSLNTSWHIRAHNQKQKNLNWKRLHITQRKKQTKPSKS